MNAQGLSKAAEVLTHIYYDLASEPGCQNLEQINNSPF